MFSVYIYDKTFDGLLTAVFDAYFRKTFPDALLSEGDALPLFCDELHTVVTDEEKAGRVWRGLQKKVSSSALGCLTQSWLSELPEVGMLIFRYIRKAIDAPRSIESGRFAIGANMEESGWRTCAPDAVCPFPESCRRYILCRFRTAV